MLIARLCYLASRGYINTEEKLALCLFFPIVNSQPSRAVILMHSRQNDIATTFHSDS